MSEHILICILIRYPSGFPDLTLSNVILWFKSTFAVYTQIYTHSLVKRQTVHVQPHKNTIISIQNEMFSKNSSGRIGLHYKIQMKLSRRNFAEILNFRTEILI